MSAARWIRTTLTGLAIALAPLAVSADNLTPEDTRRAAAQALKAGQPDLAETLARALLARDPGDVTALVLLSRVQRNTGRYAEATRTGKMAWAAAETDAQRYGAALATAQALSSRGARTRAQLWLRRAASVAPNKRLRSIALRDFNYVRDRNPWSTTLSFGVTPSSNINNGSRSEVIEIDGLEFELSGDARALSGMEYRLSADTEFSQQVRERLWLYAGASFDLKSYSLSSSARKQAPDLKASDLAYREAQLKFGLTAFPFRKLGPLDVSVTGGRAWYGGEPLADFLQVNGRQTVTLGKRNRLDFSLGQGWQWRAEDTINNSRTLTVQTAWSRKMDHGNRLSVSAGLRNTASDGAATAHAAQFASLGYSLGKPVLGARISATLSIEHRLYDDPYYSSERREDYRYGARINAVLPQFEYMGFAPEISLNAERTNSNVGLYETEDIGLSLGIRSVF